MRLPNVFRCKCETCSNSRVLRDAIHVNMSRRNFTKLLNSPKDGLSTMNLPISVKIGYGFDETLKVEATSDDDRPNCRKLTKKRRRRENFRQVTLFVRIFVQPWLKCQILILASPFGRHFASANLTATEKSATSSTSSSTTPPTGGGRGRPT